MSIVINYINIDPIKYAGSNLGSVIKDHYDEMKKCGANDVNLLVCNEHWHGSFSVPEAIGFSTPIDYVLKDATLRLCRGEDDKFFQSFNTWKSIYGGKNVRKDKICKFTSDQQTCAICTEDYEIGDNICKARPCDHQFHRKCLTKWQLKDKTVMDVVISRIMEEAIKYNCPLCQKETS